MACDETTPDHDTCRIRPTVLATLPPLKTEKDLHADVVTSGERRCLKTRMDLQLGQDALDVSPYGVSADTQFRRDLEPARAPYQEAEHLPLPSRELSCQQPYVIVAR